MFGHCKWLTGVMLLCAPAASLYAQERVAQDRAVREWTEQEVIARFESQSPQAREMKARVAAAEALARTRTVYPNPTALYSREGAGYATFFEGSQTLPVSGRLRYLREAGSASIAATEAEGQAMLWSLRSDARIAFYRLTAAQERARLLLNSIQEVERLTGVLRRREEEGEGSHYDRVRAERELTELRTDLAAARAVAAAAAGRLSGYLPEGTLVERVTGSLDITGAHPDLQELNRRAIAARAEVRALQKQLARFQSESMAASRLRFPEPTITAGVKRGNVISGAQPTPFSDETRTGLSIGVSVPLPLFNRGQYEVARFDAEQARVEAEAQTLARRIQAEVLTAESVLQVRQDAVREYRQELESAGTELTRIAQVAYQEGEIGILELLDSLRVNRTANLRLLDLRAVAKEAYIELDRAVGEEVRP